jgi:hypothetical protein
MRFSTDRKFYLYKHYIDLDNLNDLVVNDDFIFALIRKTTNIRMMKKYKEILFHIFNQNNNFEKVMEYFDITRIKYIGPINISQTPHMGPKNIFVREKFYVYVLKLVRVKCLTPTTIKYIRDKYGKDLESFIKQKHYVDDYIKKLIIRLMFVCGLMEYTGYSLDYIYRAKKREYEDEEIALKKTRKWRREQYIKTLVDK